MTPPAGGAGAGVLGPPRGAGTNDGCIAATAAASWERAKREADFAVGLGHTPILVGPAPDPNVCTTAAADATRAQVDVWGAQWAAAGGQFLQLDELWGTSTSPQQYLPDYDSGDHFHPNDPARNAAAARLVTMLQQIAGQHS